jgi:hypothetical protein
MSFGVSNDPETQRVLERHPYIDELVNSVHGSGIDYDWYADETPTNIRLYNSYHLMDDGGMYYANADFTVIIPKKNPKGFRVTYRDDRSRYYANKHMLADYLYDTISWQLSEILKQSRREKVIPDWMRKPNVWAYYPPKKEDVKKSKRKVK